MARMGLILFDDNRETLKPLTFTRPVAELRVGILTIREKWERMLNMPASHHTAPYLSTKYPANFESLNILVNGSILPTQELCDYILQTLPSNTLLVKGDTPIVLKTTQATAKAFLTGEKKVPTVLESDLEFIEIEYPWDLFGKNGAAIEADFDLLTKGRTSQPLSASNRVIGDTNRIFLEEGAWVECAILNTEGGSIYIGKNATVMEGSIIRGSFALCESATTKMAAKIYGPTTIGPHSKVGGEVNNSVILGYSNKGHDGFLGNSVLGEWCNLGADTNNSNLKNNYGEVRVWNYERQSFSRTGLQFCGLIMGDHSKSGINTMFNTGTVIGVSSNLFGGDFPRKFVPSFSWGSSKGFEIYQFKKAMETAERVMQRRNKELDEIELAILKHVFEETNVNRKY
ncbi:GlmU family protein [Aureispira sp. CCB-QB1]|uniref:GlmU family protein n=1 Tax=Aureispira sp. CCB-QB1 TaxID=1313421 RepID=UPI000AEF0A47|nr:GlmU family protein [Aureispira sp. CCB-QB1]